MTISLISADEIRQRVVRAQGLIRDAGLDALVVVGRSFYDRPGNLAYLSNHFPPFPSAVFSADLRGLGHGLLLVPAAGDPVLITDPRGTRKDLVAIDDVRAVPDLGVALINAIRDRGLSHAAIGIADSDLLPAAMYRELVTAHPDVQWSFCDVLLDPFRMIKSPGEIRLLAAAAVCADAGLMAAVEAIQRSGITEREVCAIGTAACLAAGADFVRYFRVHSGPWSAIGSRWPPATDRAIQTGEIVVLDAIGAVGGYGFDVNRTTVCSRPDAETAALLNDVAQATDRAVEAAVAGAAIADIAAAARISYRGTPWEPYQGATVGHGLGIETVELPYLTDDVSGVLQPGMVLCIEPGIFIPGDRGAAIEQEVVITPEGPPRVLTPTPTKLW